MWLQDFNDFFDCLKGSFPYYFLAIVPIFLIISPVGASHEFPVYRMQQYDLHGITHGCRKATVNLEARSVTSWSTNRHCVIVRLQELSTEKFRAIKSNAGALIVVLPQDMSNIAPDLLELESDMLHEEVQIPVFFTPWFSDLQAILDEVAAQPNDQAGSGVDALINGLAANGFQMVISAVQPSARQDVQLANIQGTLLGHGVQETLPTVAIVAHYDAFGVAPELSFGGDSNASGVAILMELARIFSSLYGNAKTHGSFNLLFLLSGAGKLNYLGSKKYLEDQIDSLEGSLLQDAAFVLCLDSLSRNNTLHIHVSKPPKEGSVVGDFVQAAQTVGNSVRVVHKKINLAEEVLAWEHERFSIRRLPALTFSALSSHRDLGRSTIFDKKEAVDVSIVAQNAAVIAESLVRMVYDSSSDGLLSGDLRVEESAIQMTVDALSNTARSQQLLSDKGHPLVATMKDMLGKYLLDVKVTTFTPDKRDPDVVFYDVTSSTLHVYNVKPAVFDLFLTIAIIVYLALVYLLLSAFPDLYSAVIKLVTSKKKIQ